MEREEFSVGAYGLNFLMKLPEVSKFPILSASPHSQEETIESLKLYLVLSIFPLGF